MRRVLAGPALMMALGLSACGGGGGQTDTPAPAPAPQLRISAAAGDTGRAPSGVVHLHRIELRNTGNAAARAVTVSASPDARALQLPLGCESPGCTPRSDGGVDIAEIPAGGAVVLRQQLRVKPGFRGQVRNDWQASSSSVSAAWQQELTAYAADLAVRVDVAASAGTTTTYAVTLANQGPDEAADIRWDLLTLPDQAWRIAGCTASTGASCPAATGEWMKLDRLPANGSVLLQVQVDEAATAGSSVRGLGSRVDAAGDSNAANNQAITGQSGVARFAMFDLEGRHYQLSYRPGSPLRATAPGVDERRPFFVDVFGAGYIGEPGSTSPPWNLGTFDVMTGPVMVLGLDITGTRKPYLAARRPVTELSELEGFSFNLLGSRADASGRAVDAYAGSARFKDGVLELCQTPTPVAQCPSAQLQRFEAAMVGDEIELVSSQRALRIRAARSYGGPILMASTRDAASGGSEFWLALPEVANAWFSAFGDLYETTFESASGASLPAFTQIDLAPGGLPQLSPRSSTYNRVLGFAEQGGKIGLCGLTAQPTATAQPGLFSGDLRGDWLTYENGAFVKERLCLEGPVHYARSNEMDVLLGARGGSLMGRWMFAGR